MAKKKFHKKKKSADLAANSSRSRSTSSLFGGNLLPGYHASDTKRDVWTVAGYPDIVDFGSLWRMFSRFGIAKAGITRIVDKCWQMPPRVIDGEDDPNREKTQFEKDFDVLINKHKLWSRLKGLDIRQRVGRYGGLIPIVRGGGEPDQELKGLQGVNAVMKLIPVFEAQIDVTNVSTVSRLDDPRYGDPEHFNFRQNVAGDRNPIDNTEIQLHPSRVFVMAEGADDGSIFGVPANEAGYNSLMDLEKIIAAGAEGHWKNAKQRIVVNINDAQVAQSISSDPKKQKEFNDQMDDFSSGFDSNLLQLGMDTKTLQSTLSDPTMPFTNALNSYVASITIPATILIGQQTGRLASDEDQADWTQTAESRQETLLTTTILDFAEYMIRIGALSKPSNELSVEWPPLSDPGQGEKLALGKAMAETNKTAREAGVLWPFPDPNEIRRASGFEPLDEDELGEVVEVPDNDD